MIRRMLVVVVLCGAAFVLAAVPALASLGGEVAAGRQVAQRVDTGAVTCSGLEDTDFEHLGEYVMGRMLGSSSTHAAINARMAAMIGDTSAEGMHELMGRRYAGCPTGGAGAAGGMMGGAAVSGGWAAMMRSRDFAWMRDGAWRHMSLTGWQAVGVRWMGPGDDVAVQRRLEHVGGAGGGARWSGAGCVGGPCRPGPRGVG
jgi:hypothetical protein